MSSMIFDITQYIKTRKKWLISLFILYALNCLIIISGLACIYFAEFSEGCSYSLLASIATILISTSLFYWFTYYCAYKNHGTAWLQFIIIVGPLKALSDYAKLSAIEIYESWPILLIQLIAYSYFIINCIRLKRANAAKNKNAANQSHKDSSIKTEAIDHYEIQSELWK